MYLIYMDDSGFHGKRQIACCTIIKDTDFGTSEGYMGYIVEQHVPEEMKANFEFHASDLFHGSQPFDKISKDTRMEIFSKCISMVSQIAPAIIYSSVDVHKLKKGIYSSSNAADVAFRLCLPEIERWFVSRDPENMGILICDEPSEKPIRMQMLATFREKRGKIRTHVEERDGKRHIDEERGDLPHLHDDMYFGSSAYSVGIQQADMCAYVIHRHLSDAGNEDTEPLFRMLKPLIFSEIHEPR